MISDALEVDIFEFVKLCQRLGDLFAGGIPEVDQGLRDLDVVFLGERFCFIELLKRNHSSREEQIGKVSHRLVHGVSLLVAAGMRKRGRKGRLICIAREVQVYRTTRNDHKHVSSSSTLKPCKTGPR